MRTLCYSVRLQSLTVISDKCYKAVAFDGSEALIPKSQYYGEDYDVMKSEAHWISVWILERVHLQYSGKKQAWFDHETGRMLPNYTIERHIPEKIDNAKTDPDGSLIR